MTQQSLFFDSIEEAAQEVGRHYPEGHKALAQRLWPNKRPDTAHKHFLDCCNLTRTEHNFTGEDWIALIKIGREIGCHAVINFICDDALYERPPPKDPEDEMDRIDRENNELLKTLVKRMDRRDALAARAQSRGSKR